MADASKSNFFTTPLVGNIESISTDAYFLRRSDRDLGFIMTADGESLAMTRGFPNAVYDYVYGFSGVTANYDEQYVVFGWNPHESTIGSDPLVNYNAAVIYNINCYQDLNGLNAGLKFTQSGIVDFANATGQIAMGLTVPLQKSAIVYINECGNVRDQKTFSLASDISSIYSAATLTVEGSLHADLYGVIDNSIFTTYYYDNNSSKIGAPNFSPYAGTILDAGVAPNNYSPYKYNFHEVVDNNRQLAAALRAQNIQLELNLTGTVNSFIRNVTIRPFVQTSVQGNTHQATGVLANGTVDKSNRDVTEGTGDIVFGGDLENGGGNGTWTGEVNAKVENVHLDSNIFPATPEYVKDADGNVLYDWQIGLDGKPLYNDPMTSTLNKYVNVSDFAEQNNGVSQNAQVSDTITIKVTEYQKKKELVLETEEKTVKVQKQVTVAVPVVESNGTKKVYLYSTNGNSIDQMTVGDLNALGYQYVKVKTDNGEFYTGYALNSNATHYEAGYLPSFIWMVSETTTNETTGEVSITGANQLVQYGDQRINIYVDTEVDLEIEKAHIDQDGRFIKAIKDSAGNITGWTLANSYSDATKYKEKVTVTVPVLSYTKAEALSGFTVDELYQVTPDNLYEDKNTATKDSAAQYEVFQNPLGDNYTYQAKDNYTWKWNYVEVEVDDLSTGKQVDKDITFTDTGFVNKSLNTQVSDNKYLAEGLSAANIVLSNVAESGTINATVDNISLDAEIAQRKYAGTVAEGESGIAGFSDNVATSIGINTDTLTVEGTYRGTINSNVSRLNASSTNTVYSYTVRTYSYDEYEMQIGQNSGMAVTATSFRADLTDADKVKEFYKKYASVNPDTGATTYVDRESLYQIDIVIDTTNWIVTGGTGYLIKREETGTSYYIDPVTKYFVNPANGCVYTKQNFTGEEFQVFYTLDPKTNDRIKLHSAGDYVVLDENQHYVKNEEYDRIHHSETFEGKLGDDTYLVDRVITQDDTINCLGIKAEAHGIRSTDITINGNFRSDVLVGIDAEIYRDPVTGEIVYSMNDYTTEENASEQGELYRVTDIYSTGITASTISVEGGLFAPNVYVIGNARNWNEDMLKKMAEAALKDPTAAAKHNTDAYYCVKADKLVADALAGDYVLQAATCFEMIDGQRLWVLNTGVAVSVKNLQNDYFITDDIRDPFDIIGNIYSAFDGIRWSVANTERGDYNLRVSGEIVAGYEMDANGGFTTETLKNGIKGNNEYYVFTDVNGQTANTTTTNADNHDRLEFAAGAYAKGNIQFSSGNDMLILDSNARLENAAIVHGTGHLNMVFNLNDKVLDADDYKYTDDKAIITGSLDDQSTILYAITLNDIVMDGTGPKEYKLFKFDRINQAEVFGAKIRTVDLKYDGMSVKTLDLSDDIVAEVGYYDDNDWVVCTSQLVGYEFRENNFTAKIGSYDGATSASGTKLGNYIRVVDNANGGTIIFQAHSECVNRDWKIVVDVLPDQKTLPNGETYYVSSFDIDINNLRQWYDRENNTVTFTWDDHSIDISQTVYQFEYYILNADGTKTNTIMREITSDSPRVSLTLENIDADQTIIWRVRQSYGIGNDITGDWNSIEDYKYERAIGLLQTDLEDSTSNLEWKNELSVSSMEKYVVYYYVEGDAAVRTYNVAKTTQSKVVVNTSQFLQAGEVLTGWEVGISDAQGNDLAENAIYQNLDVDWIQYAPLTGLGAAAGANKSLILSWNNVSQSDVSFVLRYRIGNDSAGYGEWTTVVVDAVDPGDASTVSYTVNLESYLKSDELLQWEVFAQQINGDEILRSEVSGAKTSMILTDGVMKVNTTTLPNDDAKEVGTVTMVWENTGTEDTTFLLEYVDNGVRKSVEIKSGMTGVTYNDDNTVSYSFKPSTSTTTAALDWRVRRYVKDASGNPVDVGEWMIYEIETMTSLERTSEVVHDDSLNKDTISTTLHFESNVPGSAYRLEYVVVTNNYDVSNPVAVDFDASNDKVFTYTVEGLAADGSQEVYWRITTVDENGGLGEWTYETREMQEAFSDVVFCDKPQDAVSTEESGQTAVATLKWNAGENMTQGTYTYEVEYFQKSDYLSDAEVMAYFDQYTDEATADVLDDAFARLQVTNNQITITALEDTKYVYWRVRSLDNQGVASDWTVGDPFHVYLDDVSAPTFKKDPVGEVQWVSRIENDARDTDLMDVYLTWDKASDDKAGVKCYNFTYGCTTEDTEQLHNVKYYYSTDNGVTWNEFAYDEDNGARIDHIEGVGTYIIKIQNLANGNYEWNLTATDYQGKTSETAKSGEWLGDFDAPEFAEDTEDTLTMNVKMAAALSDTVAGNTDTVNKIATLAPILTWTPAEDELSGVEYYQLNWSDAAQQSYSVKISVDELTLDAATGTYTWQLLPGVPYDSQDDKILGLVNGDYTWTFYAVDYMGNVANVTDIPSLAGKWIGDYVAPVFTTESADCANAYILNLIDVNMTWTAATDYWFDPGEDPDTLGSGVKYYTVTYWLHDETDPEARIGEVTETVYTEYTNGWQPGFTAVVINGDYRYEITATDYMGNTSESTLTGEWEKNDNPELPEIGTSTVSFNRARMIGGVSWEQQSFANAQIYYYELKYSLISGGAITDIDSARVLHGFTGDISAFSSIATFTQNGTNTWNVIFKDDTSTKYTLTYDATTGNYTMSFDLVQDGVTSPSSITYNAADGTYTASYDITNNPNYIWTMYVKGTLSNSSDIQGLTYSQGTWQGDDAAPVFTRGAAAVTADVVYDRQDVAGVKKTIATVTVTVDDSLVADYKLPGNYEEAGCGVAYYTISYGAADADGYDYSVKFDASLDADVLSSTTLELDPSVNYKYKVTATDWVGENFTVDSGEWAAHTSSAVNGTIAKDSVAPQIADEIETLSDAGFTGNSNKMLNVLTWTAAEDDRVVAGDGTGSGVSEYTVGFSYKSGDDTIARTISVMGNDFETFSDEEFTGYKREVDANGVITYSKSKKEDDGNYWKLVYTCKYTDTNGEEQGGEYVLTFTLNNATYNWSIYATDYAGNSGQANYSRTGTWNADVAAPTFVVPVTNKIGASLTVPGTMYAEVSWTYSKTEEMGVIDPTVANSTLNDGSTVEYFTFQYRLKDATTWNSIRVDVGRGNDTDSKFTITYSDGTYVARAESLLITDYEWRVDATDYMGNTTLNTAAGANNSGTWADDNAAPRFLPLDGTDPETFVTTNAEYSLDDVPGIDFSVTWAPAVDDWQEGTEDGTGMGVRQYTFEYRLAGTENEWSKQVIAHTETATSYIITLQNQPNGDYEWRLTATDWAGQNIAEANTSEAITGTIYADITAPVFAEAEAGGEGEEAVPAVSVTNEYDKAGLSNKLSFTWTAADDVASSEAPERLVSGFWKYQLSYGLEGSDATGWMTVDITEQDMVSYTFTSVNGLPLTEGKYNWTISALDHAGNAAVVNGNAFYIDYTAPEFLTQDVEAGMDYEDTGLSITLEWTAATDAVSGVDFYTLKYRNVTEGGEWQSVTVEPAADGANSHTLSGLANGDYEWELYATDNMENVTDTPLTGSILSDLTAPEFSAGQIILTDSYDAETQIADLEFLWTRADDPDKADGRVVSGFDRYEIACRIQGTEEWTVITAIEDQDVTGLSFSVPGSITEGETAKEVTLEDGIYEWKVSAFDKAGNEKAKLDVPDTFMIDTTGPAFEEDAVNSVKYDYDPSTKTYRTITFDWDDATDDVSGLAGYEVSFGYTNEAGEYITVGSYETDAGKTEYTVTNQMFRVDGNYTWQVKAIDNMGNSTVLTGSESIEVDTTAPEGKFTAIDEKPLIEAEWTVSQEYEHPIYITTYTVKSAIVTFNLEGTFEDESGEVTYEIATYGRGESGEVVRMQTFTVDADGEFILDATAGQGAGYLANMLNNTVYWKVRAVDAFGNATGWYDGATFKMIDTDSKSIGKGQPIVDKQKPSTPMEWFAKDYTDTGLLYLYWTPATDGLGVDSYVVKVYDKSGKNLIGTFNSNRGENWVALNQNDLACGECTFSVAAIDCAGNTGKATNKVSFTYDIVRPTLSVPDGTIYTVDAASNVIFQLSALDVIDNLPGCEYAIKVYRESTGQLLVNDIASGDTYTWYPTEFGDYVYEIYAQDAHGNLSSECAKGIISLAGKETQDFNWSQGCASGTVGNGKPSDTWNFVIDTMSVDDKTTATELTITITALSFSGDDGIDVIIRDNYGECVESFTIMPDEMGETISHTFFANEAKDLSAKYTVEVIARDPSVKVNYTIGADRNDFTESNVLDDTFQQARDLAQFRINLDTDSNSLNEEIISNEWLGYSDYADFRQITVEKDGTYDLNFQSDSGAVKATLWQMTPNGQLSAIAYAMPEYGEVSMAMESLALEQGETYYLGMESTAASEGIETRYSVGVVGVIA